MLGIFAEQIAMIGNQILLRREGAEPPVIKRAGGRIGVQRR
jgi:hypothetical protein